MNSVTISIPKLILYVAILAVLFLLVHLGTFELLVAGALTFFVFEKILFVS